MATDFIMFILILVLCLIFPQDVAYAYIDPGTGSSALQILLAFFLGAIVTIKIYFNKIKKYIKNLFKKND